MLSLEKDYQLETQVYEYLRDSLDNNYEIIHDYGTALGEKFDLAIIRNRKILALIDIKLFAKLYGKNPLMYDSIISKGRFSGAEFLVVTDNDDYIVFSGTKRQPSIIKRGDFVNNLKSQFVMVSEPPSSETIADIISSLAKECRLGSVIKRFLIKAHFTCNPTSGTISFADEPLEDAFFRKLLPIQRGIKQLCRYTSIDSAFELLKSGSQNMCNPLCMNDKSEGRYADEKVFYYKPSVNEKAFADSDKCYILSLMNKSMEDNLTMWRLYGNEARGACLRYEVKESYLENKKAFPFFYLASVSYGEWDKKRQCEIHKELDFLRMIHQCHFGNGWQFEFKRWGIWKHFFKSYLFRDEREIRLLYYDADNKHNNYDWIKNRESQIVTKMLKFPFDQLPLHLSSVMIGPKCPEPDFVARQLNHMDMSNLIGAIKVESSSITIYR